MVEEMKMEVNSSDDETNFIRRPAVLIQPSDPYSDEETRPVTPPMDQSIKLNKSLGVIMSPQSPPYRRIRSMKLIESPRQFLKSRLDIPVTSTPTISPCAQDSFRRVSKTAPLRLQRSRLSHLGQCDKDKPLSPAAYVNPFSPNCSYLNRPVEVKSKNRPKRLSQKSFSYDSDDNIENDSFEEQDSQVGIKKPKLSDFNIPRYQEEFIEIELIGTGDHGRVFKCLNRLNGVEYAVKRGLKPIINEDYFLLQRMKGMGDLIGRASLWNITAVIAVVFINGFIKLS